MGQFKPMVKMETTEPSVILKLKKGGKVASKADGGFMPMQSSQPAMPSGLPARGGMTPGAAPMKPSMSSRRRAMMPAKPAMNPNMLMKKGGKAESKHEDAAQDRAMIKKALAGKKFADGGNVTASMAKTTVKGNTSKFAKTDMETADRTTKVKGTGGVKNGNAGGYANGGTIKGNVSKFAKTDMATADRNDSAKGTKGVKNGNAGGFAKGGTISGGNWENKPADTAKPGKSGGSTGGVRNGNAGGYKKGGSAKKAFATGGNVVDDGRAVAMPKKHVSQPVANSLQSGTFKKGGKVQKYRDGDSVDVDPTPSNSVNMRRVPKKVGKYAEGGLEDASKGAYDKSIGPSEEDMDMARAIRSVPRKLYQGAKNLLGGLTGADKAPGAVTKTKESVTVAPRKRGGRC